MSEPNYYLVPRRAGTALFGASVPQVVLVAIGAGGLAMLPTLLGGSMGVILGVGILVGCLLLAFTRAGGAPLVHALPAVIGYLFRARVDRVRRRPQSSDGAGEDRCTSRAAGRVEVPGLSRSVELLASPAACRVPTRSGEPAGLVWDGSGRTITAVLDVRGGPFGLLDGAGRDRRVVEWSRVLSQFAREAPVAQLGWTVRSGLGASLDPPAEPTSRPASAAAEVLAYQNVLAEARPLLTCHELRLWLTVRPTRASRQADARHTALAALEMLAERCTAAGLHVAAVLTAEELTDTVLDHADPLGHTGLGPAAADLSSYPGLVARAHLPDTDAARRPRRVPADGLDVHTSWDAMRIGATWHRVFWVAGWPSGGLRPGWLDPLLHEVPCVRTLAVAMRPVPWRASRRRINSDSVSIDTAVHLRDRHAFRVPVGLHQAHDDVDRRDAELTAGYPEYAYLGLLDIAAPGRGELDGACAAIVDLAARCGIVDVRPLHGRHHQAWPATLPFGLVPRQSVMGAP
ncbi:SCO6880 family protein [Frankia sp. AgB32]|uniref:SCO6880 family protein n=1 Tax=Frankia sp. AgB32 TaxID=631119 RepID=UPI0020108239|nr:SCO6880 family protein [Frankia sp. AgB32]MCK9895029.1 hypothetical protein [Frankia sp. AgB32]